MINDGTGRNSVSSDILEILLVLKENVMLSTNVAEVCKVIETSNDTIKCSILTNEEIITCVKLMNLEIAKNDIVLVIFTDSDFRQNLRKTKLGKMTTKTETKVRHTRDFGVVVGIIYKNQN